MMIETMIGITLFFFRLYPNFSNIRGRSSYDESEEIENRLTSLIVRVGDKSSSSLESNLSMLSDALETDIPRHKKLVIETIIKWYYHITFPLC